MSLYPIPATVAELNVMRGKMNKRIFLVLLLVAYVLSFVLHVATNTKKWSEDDDAYVIYSKNQNGLFLFHKPMLYIYQYAFGKPYIFGHHTDPDGKPHGYYY